MACYPRSRAWQIRQIQFQAWRVSADRARIAASSDQLQKSAWTWLKNKFGNARRPDPSVASTGFSAEKTAIAALGLALRPDAPRSIYRSGTDGNPSMQVHSVRYALRPHRTEPRFAMSWWRSSRDDGVTIDPNLQKEVDHLGRDLPSDPKGKDQKYRPDFNYRGGCTLLIDGENGMVRYAIVKDILSETRFFRRRQYESGDAADGFGMTFTGVRQAQFPNRLQCFIEDSERRSFPAGLLQRDYEHGQKKRMPPRQRRPRPAPAKGLRRREARRCHRRSLRPPLAA